MPPRRTGATPSPSDQALGLRQTFGENFRQARLKAGLSQRDVEARTGIGQHYISLIETGKQNVTVDTMSTLAATVGSDVRTLLKPLPSRRGTRS